jgi:hypothetical protein
LPQWAFDPTLTRSADQCSRRVHPRIKRRP